MLVGSTDRQLVNHLRHAGANVSMLEMGQLSKMAAPSAPQPDVIVLDLRGDRALPPLVGSIRRQHPGTGVVIVVSSLEPALLVDAMRAGVNELVSDPVSQADLEQAILNVSGHKAASGLGQVFAFVGAKGGVGATTIAVNVASALGSTLKESRGLLVDLHQAGGDAAIFVGAEPRFSVVDALENMQRMDRTFLHNLVTPVAPQVDLLSSPDRSAFGPFDAARVRGLVEFMATTYRYVVLDLPRSDRVVLDSLDAVTTLVVVANQELATVRNANRLVGTLRQRYGREKVKVVLGRSDRESDIGRADVERAIGARVAHALPSDYRAALHALNKGRPLTLGASNDLSAALKRLALDLAGIDADRPEPARAGLLGRLRWA